MIADPYLLVLNVPLHWDQGAYWADPLWRKDLEAHCVQIADLSIACPVRKGPVPAGWTRLSRTDIRVHPLPAMRRSSWLALPWLATKLWQAITPARIIHTGVAGWPFPLGWIAIPIAQLRGRFLVMVVESAFWRLLPGRTRSPLAQIRAVFFETINKAMIRRCDITFFTTASYRDTLNADAANSAHVLPANWVDEEQLIGINALADLRKSKGRKLLFAGRLTTGKGVDVLLDAVRLSRVPVDIIGEGELRDAVVQAQDNDPDLVRLLDPIDYGPAFFTLLDNYAALVVPTITDEQPRIIFDAFARGVPVLATDTAGNRQVVEHDRNGLLYAPGDVAALADTLIRAMSDPAHLQAMGTSALRDMATQTHASMHAMRARKIAETLETKPRM